jgi:Dyp-type peroxidase family
VSDFVDVGPHSAYDKSSRAREEGRLWSQKRRQRGVSFPSSAKQEYLLVVRLDLKPSSREDILSVRKGLKKLCGLFERIDNGDVKMEVRDQNGDLLRVPLSDFKFSATVGFGFGFFEKLAIDRQNRPRRLLEMPTHTDLGDSAQYMFTQTDLIIQLCSSRDFVNRWVFRTDSSPLTPSEEQRQYQSGSAKEIPGRESHDIITAVEKWAEVTDIHSGFQRLDGRNLMGFMDGISQPERLRNDVVWTTTDDEKGSLIDGTYMVFQKIEHNLDLWERLSVSEQERWVGRSKGTGLLLGTLSREEDEKLAEQCRSNDPLVSKTAKLRLRKLLEEQKDPYSPLYSSSDPRHRSIRLECPVWSHVRKANPRGAEAEAKKIIFRRGYLFMEDTIHPGRRPSSGLLFICFQRDIRHGFEYIKKNYLNNKNFPVPNARKKFSREELAFRRIHGRFTVEELKKIGPYQKSVLGVDPTGYASELKEAIDPDLQNTGKEGLAGPSQMGIYPRGDLVITHALGGGYYFIPPIPNKKISEIGQQFFK